MGFGSVFSERLRICFYRSSRDISILIPIFTLPSHLVHFTKNLNQNALYPSNPNTEIKLAVIFYGIQTWIKQV